VLGVGRRLLQADQPGHLLVSAAEAGSQALGQLRQLQRLSLHYDSDELIMSSQLAPLSSCSLLSALMLDSLVVEPGHSSAAAAAAAAPADHVWQAARQRPAGATPATLLLPQLVGPRRLRAGLLAQAPLATLAPSCDTAEGCECCRQCRSGRVLLLAA